METVQLITNQEAARVLFQIGSLLETMQVNPYRVRAYRRAALAVLFLPRELADYACCGETPPLHGVGERLRGRIEDLVNTGHMGVHDALMEEIGEPMASLLSVQGIGPKTAVRLISELRVGSLADVKQAVAAHRIQALRGFGPKREKKIGQAVEDVLEAA